MEYKAKILQIEFLTEKVKRFVIEKPPGYSFFPGQSTLIAINQNGFSDKKRPFSFTSLNSDLVLELIVKAYKDHRGVTQKLHELQAGDELLISDPFGKIKYRGLGVFLAAGVGISPFMAISRQLNKEGKLKGNKLFYSSKKENDVLFSRELKFLFNDKDLILTLTGEKKAGFEFGRINDSFLKEKIKDYRQNFYLCGPPLFVIELKKTLLSLGVEPQFLEM